MDRFNADKRIFCFILSTRSGGVGVNLTGADTVLFYDSDWNPTMDAQAQDRCHRIGQTRDVHIYRLISDRTVEENILKKANQKRMLGDLAIEGGNFTTTFFKEQTIRELFDLPAEEPKKELAPLTLPPSQPDEEDSMSAKQTLILEQVSPCASWCLVTSDPPTARPGCQCATFAGCHRLSSPGRSPSPGHSQVNILSHCCREGTLSFPKL
ncbi:helicase SRCAP-like [Chiloscyllium plagiosum]|uniref:helicase SRCAP-like n=1 Tax=Chiloscyllium plagiosum TaxID=36176 RepID=UPI001CB849FC|nr:helicase SRCAP-like [Chiloscyllium plagiosum]